MCEQGNCTESSDPIVYSSFGERIVYATITCMICVTGAIGNTLVILAVFISKKLRNKTNTFVVNLAVADLVSCLNLPWMSLAIVSVDRWPLWDWVCMWEGMCLMVSTGCSLYTLGGIAMSRACLITLPNYRFHELLTPKTLAILLLIFWMIPVSVAAIPFSVSYHFFGFNSRYSMCIWNTTHHFSPTYNVIIASALYPIPLIIIFLSYVRIWWYVRVNSRRMERATTQIVSVSVSISGAAKPRNVFSARQMSVTKNLFLIIFIFLLLTSPYTILLVIPGGEKLVPGLAVIFLCNSCVNPLIYGTRHPDFKVAFRSLLRCPTRRSNRLSDSTSSTGGQDPQVT